MSVQPVVPATLLEDIKKGLVALGYAHLDTPLSFIQDCYFKYVMVHQVAMAKGFSPQIPYALALLPQAIQDQLVSSIVGIFNQWGNTGGLFAGPTQSAEVTDAYLADFDYPVTRTGFTDCKQADFVWVLGTTSNEGAMQDPMVGDAAYINRRGQLDIKLQDFEWFEMVLSKSNGFPISAWPEFAELNDKPPYQPSEGIYIQFAATQPGILKSTVNRQPQPDVDMGQDELNPTRLKFDVRRDPSNIDQCTISVTAYNGTMGELVLVNNASILFPESGVLNLSAHAITKVGKESTRIEISSTVNNGNES